MEKMIKVKIEIFSVHGAVIFGDASICSGSLGELRLNFRHHDYDEEQKRCLRHIDHSTSYLLIFDIIFFF